MRFWLPLIEPSGGTVLTLPYIESTYDGDLWVHMKKSAGVAATANIYAATEDVQDARGCAIADDTTYRVGTVTAPDTTSARTQATNKTYGPNMANTYFTWNATGAFTSAVYAFTAAPHAELMDRMKRILQNYCAVNEPLRRFGLAPTAIDEGLIDGMTGFAMPRMGIKMLNYRKLPGAPKVHDNAAVDVLWTVWVQEFEHPSEAEAEALEIEGQLYSIAVESHRHWANMVHETTIGSTSISQPVRISSGEYDRFTMMVKLNMTCMFTGGQWHDDPVSSLKGGHYEQVTLT